MTTFENLDGDKLLAIFRQLVRQKIFVKVYLPQVNYESLTVVTDTHDSGRQPTFQIDVPEGLLGAIKESKSNQLLFEFINTDKVTHSFKSDVLKIRKKSISMLYPPIIQRHQKRENFRIKAPFDSFAVICLEGATIRMEVDNVSLGGVYCYCPNRYKASMVEGLVLADMGMTFTLRNKCSCVTIQQATIKRVESRHRPKRFGIAFEFIKVDRDNRKLLVQLIYNLQRAYLKNRLKNV